MLCRRCHYFRCRITQPLQRVKRRSHALQSFNSIKRLGHRTTRLTDAAELVGMATVVSHRRHASLDSETMAMNITSHSTADER